MKKGKRAIGSVFQRSQDGRWVVRAPLPDGKRITRYAHSKLEAEKLLAQLLNEPLLAPSEYTLETFMKDFLEREETGRAAGTILERRRVSRIICKGLGKYKLENITPIMVQRWVDSLEGAHSSQKKALNLLKTALNKAVVLEYIRRNPALSVTLERRPQTSAGKVWTIPQIQAFLEATKGHRCHLLWKLGLQTGARIGELLALRVEDYDPERETLRIQRTAKPSVVNGNRKDVGKQKTDAALRTFPLGRDAQQTVEAALVVRSELAKRSSHYEDEGWLFPAQFGTMQQYNNVRREWVAAIKTAGVPHIRMHDMRHTFISLGARRGVKAEVMARIVGHSDPTTTLKIYRKIYEDEIEKATKDDLADLF